MTRATALRALAWLALILVALYLGYLVAANALLNSHWAQRQLERTPGVTVSWEHAWTAFPGQLRVTHLRLAGTAAERRYALRANAATLHVALTPLLAGELQLRELDAEGIRQARLDAYRLQGRGTLRLAGVRWHAGELSVNRLAVALATGTLQHGDTPLVEQIALEADLRLAPLTLAEHPGQAAARFVSGTLVLAGRSNAYEVFNPYLARLDWLEIGGHGDLHGELAITAGELQPGSHLRLDSPRLSVRLDERRWLANGARYHLQGAGTVTADISETTRLAVALDDLEMFELPAEAAPSSASRRVLSGERFQLELAAAPLQLHAPPDDLQQAALRWQRTETTDIAAFDRYLPEPVPLALEGGSARLEGELTYAAGRLAGGFDLTGDALALRLGEQPLTGRLALHLPIAELDVTRGILDLSGARLDLEASVPGATRPLTTALALPTARFHSPQAWQALDDGQLFGGEVPWDATMALGGQVANLGVLDPLLADLFGDAGLALEGGGRLTGTLHIRDGQPLAGSRLEVRSDALGARFRGFHARGDGQARLLLEPGDSSPEANVELAFDEVALTRLADGRRLFQADQLLLTATAQARSEAMRSPSAQVTWRGARLPDVNVLDAYLPPSAPLRLDGGQANSDGQLRLQEERLRGRLTLAGNAIDGRLLEEDFHGELDATLALRDLDPARQRLDISGSRVEVSASNHDAAPLRTLLVVRQASLQGGVDWPGREAPRQPLSGTLRLEGLLDRLSFLNAYLPEEHGLALQGGGRLSADLRFADGEALPGSRLDVHAERLAARFLHYEAFGDGSLRLEITDPGATLHLSLPRFGLRRQAGTDTLIEGRLLDIHSRARHFAFPEGLRSLSTRIDMPHVVAPNLATFNDYLPAGGGIELLAGQATIATHLKLEGTDAVGTLALQAPRARLAFNEQTLDGELRLAMQLADGDLETLSFDVSGSQLNLDDVRLTDDSGHLTRGWWAQLALAEGRMRWATPLDLDARLELTMRDSGLLANLFIDAARERRWLRDRLTLGEVHGQTRVTLSDDTLRLEDLAAYGGSRLELLANLALRDSRVAGRAFARYGPLQLGIELDEGRRRWQLRNAREWYTSARPASALTLPERRAWFDQLDAQPD